MTVEMIEKHGAVKQQPNHWMGTTKRHEKTRNFLTTDHTDYTDNTINASQTSAEVLKVLSGRDMMDCWRSRRPPSARRLSSLREAGTSSCGSSMPWRKSFSKNKKMNDSSTDYTDCLTAGADNQPKGMICRLRHLIMKEFLRLFAARRLSSLRKGCLAKNARCWIIVA